MTGEADEDPQLEKLELWDCVAEEVCDNVTVALAVNVRLLGAEAEYVDDTLPLFKLLGLLDIVTETVNVALADVLIEGKGLKDPLADFVEESVELVDTDDVRVGETDVDEQPEEHALID